MPLPSDVAAIHGPLRFPAGRDRPYVVANFVTTLDGVVSLELPGDTSGGGRISGFNQHDRMVMGLLRAVSDVVLVGAGTVRASPTHIWNPGTIYPALAGSFEALRSSLGKTGPPLIVVVTARGDLDHGMRILQADAGPVLIVTTPPGSVRLRDLRLPASVQVSVVETPGRLSARGILDAIAQVRSSDVLLLEGGPHLLGDFLLESCVHEQFLTLAPQVAGRDGSVERPGLVAGMALAPGHPRWGTLVSVKRGESHLFLRYAFSS